MQNEQYIIDVKINADEVGKNIGELTQRLQELKADQKELTEQFRYGQISATEYGKAMAANKGEIESVNRAIKSNTAMLQASTIATVNETMSLDDQRQALNTAQKAYAALTGDAKKAADAEGGLRDQINALSDAVKKQESAIGDNRRNVGNYAGSILDAAKGMGGFGGAVTGVINPIKNANLAMKAMAANPIVAILGVIIMLVTKLADKFKANGAAMESLTKVMGAFNGVGVIVEKLIDGIAKGVSWLADKLYDLADSFGLISAEMKEAGAIAQDELNLQKKQSQQAMEIAEQERDIAELRAKAAEKDKYSAAERLKFLQEANDKEEAIAQKQYDLAKEAWEIQKRKNAQSESSQEEIKKENDLYIAMVNSETALNNKRRDLNKQMATLRQQESAEAQAASEQRRKKREADAKAAEDLERQQAATLEAIQRKAEDLRVSLIGDAGARALEQRRVQGQREIAELQKQLATDKTLTEESRTQLADLIKAKEKALQDELTKMAEDAAKERIQKEAEQTRKSEMDILNLKKEVAKEGSREMLALQLQYLDLQKQQELEKYAEGSDARLLIEEQFQQAKADLEAKYRTENAQAVMDGMSEYMSQFSALNTAISDIQNAELEQYKQDQEEKKKALDKRLKSGEISEEQYAAETQKLDEETAQKEKELALQQAKRNKAMNIMQTVINTAAAIMKIWADVPKMDFGASTIALTAVAAALGAAQIAAIAAEPLPQFAEGGVVPGTSYTGDKVLARLNSGEGVLTQQGMQNLQDAANNGLGMGVNYDAMAAAMTQAVAAMPAPRMAYDEFKQFEQNVATYNEIAAI